MEMFVDVILPLPLYSSYTYMVPPAMTEDIEIGSRVMVQFGKKKYYTALVTAIHSNKPRGYEVKEIMSVLDSRPVIRYPQMKLWRWISEYYLCSVGEVYNAALPTGLKPESETIITYNKNWELPEDNSLTDYEAVILQYMQEKGKSRIAGIEYALKIKNPIRIIRHLLESGALEIDEKVRERYRPKKVSLVELTLERGDNEGMHQIFDKVSRSRQQEKMLICWLDMSQWLHPQRPLKEVEREILIKQSGGTPSTLKALVDKGILRIIKKKVNRFQYKASDDTPILSPLSEPQSEALAKIKDEYNSGKNVVLLHGVTGSGKTEIYSHLMSSVLAAGNQVLYLVPEISLTTQLTDRLQRMFGDRLIVYHSKFSDNERVDIWNKLLTTNEPYIILGARSSVFLPFAKLGLVIVDEEHESSYKQYDPAPRYNARDTSIMLATMHGASVLLGSATPSIETYYKGIKGKYGFVTLSERYTGVELPNVEVIDMKDQRKRKENKGSLSSPLMSLLKSTLSSGRQAIVFQNRRGFSPVVVCKDCGWTPKCLNCDVSLVYHKHSNMLRCHYCGYAKELPPLCPACGGNTIETYGYGTERIAEELHEEFRGYRVARMDLDTTKNKDSHQEIIEEFADHQTDILVGTQMVSKGLDFAKVDLVGVINADTLLNFPDFRSNERAYNMLEQVAGRAGRKDGNGRVLIQTTQTGNPVLKYVVDHNYVAYYESEIIEREKYLYPPYSKIINIYIKNKDAYNADMAAVIFAKKLREVFGDRVLGPEKPFVSRVALWYLQSIMLKIEAGASMKKVKDLLRNIYASIASDKYVKTSMVYYDVDPV